MPAAITPDLYKSLRQHMLQEPSDKLVDRHGHVNNFSDFCFLYLNVTVLHRASRFCYRDCYLNRYTESTTMPERHFPCSRSSRSTYSQHWWYLLSSPRFLSHRAFSLGICGRGLSPARKKSLPAPYPPLPCESSAGTKSVMWMIPDLPRPCSSIQCKPARRLL